MSSLVMDAAFPPPGVPAGVAGVMGYLGQRGRTPHVWTPAEWGRFREVRQFPVWVPDFAESPVVEAGMAADAALALGWAAGEPPDQTRVIVLDMETRVDRQWYASWAAVVTRNGFAPVAYGSLSTVLQNAADDVIAADWDGIRSIPAGQTIHGLQYASTAGADYSVFDSWLMARGGVGPRKGA
jgi:hypothetical protein